MGRTSLFELGERCKQLKQSRSQILRKFQPTYIAHGQKRRAVFRQLDFLGAAENWSAKNQRALRV